MTKYRLLSMIAALAVLGLGGLYLARGTDTLGLVLPAVTVCFWIIAALQFLETKSAGARGIIALLPAIGMTLVAAFATIGTLGYWIGIR